MPVTRAIISIETNHAIEQSKKDFKRSCDFFLSNYGKIKNKLHEKSSLPRGGSAMSQEDFDAFMNNVDGYFNNKMAEVRGEYTRARIDNLKVKRKWRGYMSNIRAGHRKGNSDLISHTIHDIRNNV
tara:strand:+ start:3924 stop:4301 length:378 start_codon:yes stop_codon:yes gene_type:complete